MFSRTLINGFDTRGLRNLLLVFFLALAVPTVVLVWQAYSQLKWEAFHQYRGVAEELATRIDTRLNDMIDRADSQSFGDYTFLVLSGDPSAKFVQRSSLSAFPVNDEVPGVIGHFQVDTDGVFSTPLLPSTQLAADEYGIGVVEYADREQIALKLQGVLSDNRLLRSRQNVASRTDASAAESETPVPEEGKDANSFTAGVLSGSAQPAAGYGDVVDSLEEIAADPAALSNEASDENAFDQLNQPERDTPAYAAKAISPAPSAIESRVAATESSRQTIGKVSDLKLDADLQKKSEDAERSKSKERLEKDNSAMTPGRSKRREQIALPESAPLGDDGETAGATGFKELRISTFESEIDPFEFSLLDSGHFVLFRKVWRDGDRYTQGVLFDGQAFIQEMIGTSFMETSLSDMSSLIVAYQDDVIRTFSGRDRALYSNVSSDLSGELLYRSRLSSPFGSLELIFSIKQLPAGPGASVLAWVTLILAIVFVVGFVTLYRLGASQISLARQQQDFVSAVSHELKSPLTSIRMYGEMLKEGWADEDKRQSYYEFIHDESERLSRLISNVLQLASITRNEPQFDIESVTVAQLMSNTESKVSSQIERAGFELTVTRSIDADSALINMDEDCFTQIIINLVDNAIKFSKDADKKRIEISSQLSGDDQVLISVRDFGPGIAKDQMKKIFQLFYRSESELTRETVGTGIGLSIVHQLTSAMNGKVDLVNSNPGAEFKLVFPKLHQEPDSV